VDKERENDIGNMSSGWANEPYRITFNGGQMAVDTVNVRLDVTSWVQTLQTSRGAGLRMRAVANWSNQDFIIENVGSIAGISFEVTFVRGQHDWQTPAAPEGSLGFLAYHSAQPEEDDFGAFISGGCSIPTEFYDDLWQRLKYGAPGGGISFEVGPVDFSQIEEVTWLRGSQKFLYIVAAEFTFVTEEKAPPERG
jgi:hypothetical protein